MRASTEAGAPPEIELIDFDCFSAYEHKEGESLRAHRGGGPHGAAWNWYGGDLDCRCQVRSSCRGDAVAKLRVGKHHESARAFSLGADVAEASVRSVSFSVAAHHWERELEASGLFPFETLTIVARIDGRCVTPPGADTEPVHLVDGFVGRFSGGE